MVYVQQCRRCLREGSARTPDLQLGVRVKVYEAHQGLDLGEQTQHSSRIGSNPPRI